MAQPTTGKASAPIARSNAPISIFAKEEKNPMTKQAVKQAVQPAAEAIVTPVAEPVAAKAAKTPKDPAKVAAAVVKLNQTPLERVVAQQAGRVDHRIIRHFTARVRARMQAGQDNDTAMRETFAQYAELVATVIAADADAESKAEQFATSN